MNPYEPPTVITVMPEASPPPPRRNFWVEGWRDFNANLIVAGMVLAAMGIAASYILSIVKVSQVELAAVMPGLLIAMFGVPGYLVSKLLLVLLKR